MNGSGAARARLLVAACAALLFALSFVPLWATYRVPGLGLVAPATVRHDAWGAYGLGMEVALVLALAVVGLTIVAGVTRAAAVRVTGGLLFALSVAVTSLLTWQAVAGPEGSSNPNGYGISRGVLLFVGIGLACGMTYGGHLLRRETGAARASRG